MGFEVPWRRVEEERDQLWSAALAAYRAGAEHEYRTGEIAKLRDYIQQFNDDDVWSQDISSYLATVEETTTRDVLRVGLNVDIHKTGIKESRRVNDILTRLGWRRQQTTRDGRSTRIWIRPEGDVGPDQSHIKEDF
jgi:predicted P-loop ATPase